MDRHSSILFFQTQLPKLFFGIIPFISDKSNDLGDASLGKSDSPAIGVLIDISNRFSL